MSTVAELLDEEALSWRASAAYRGHDTRIFFTERGESGYEEARAICGSCTVVEHCLEAARTLSRGFGLWGGLSPQQRRRRRRGPRARVRVRNAPGVVR